MTKIHYIIFIITFVLSSYAIAEGNEENQDDINPGTIVCKPSKVSGQNQEEAENEQYPLCPEEDNYSSILYIALENQKVQKEEAEIILEYITAKIGWLSTTKRLWTTTDIISMLNEVSNSEFFPFKSKFVVDEQVGFKSQNMKNKSEESEELTILPEPAGEICTELFFRFFCVEYETTLVPLFLNQ